MIEANGGLERNQHHGASKIEDQTDFENLSISTSTQVLLLDDPHRPSCGCRSNPPHLAILSNVGIPRHIFSRAALQPDVIRENRYRLA